MSRSRDRLDLADVFITPISGQLALYLSVQSWHKTPGTFDVETKEKSGVHNHFVLHDCTGHGLYIVCDRYRREVHRRECSMWDLGQSFASQVMETLKEFA
jgi:hypothetical protein